MQKFNLKRFYYTNEINLRVLILGLVFLSAFNTGFSQEEISFSKIETKDNISQSIIYCLAQDSLGNIWAGTEEGVIKYNSRDLFLYNRYKGLPDSSSSRISSILIDNEQNIWVGTEKGLLKYFPLHNSFKFIKENNKIKSSLISCISEGNTESIWIGAFDGLWKLDKRTNQLSNVLKDKNITCLEKTNRGILVGTTKGLYVYNDILKTAQKILPDVFKSHFTISSIKKIRNDYFIGTISNGFFKLKGDFNNAKEIIIPVFSEKYFRINSIEQINDKNILVGTDGMGLVFLDIDGNYINSYLNDVNIPNSISSNGIYDLLISKEGMVWIATYGGGVNMINLKKPYFTNITHIINEKNSLLHNFIRAIAEDNEGRLWLGTKQGLSIWNRKTNIWINKRSFISSSKTSEIILSLQEDGDYMWVGTYGNGVFKIDKKTLKSTHYSESEDAVNRIFLSKAYSIFKDSKNRIWIGGIEGDLCYISPSNSIKKYSLDLVKDIIELHDNSILTVGRFGANIIIGDSIIVIDELNPENGVVDYTNINCAIQHPDGTLILGTNGGGLIFFDFKTKKISKLNIAKGMPSDIVQKVILYDKSNLWISTTRGLAHVILSEKDTSIIVYNKDDGLVNNEFNYGSGTKLSDGKLIFGGVDGASLFNPNDIKLEKDIPTLVFEKFKLFNSENKLNDSITYQINTTNKLNLKYNESSFNIEYIGILHNSPSKVQYKWKMSGLNEDWTSPSFERQVNFINLSPGKYQFHIKASNRDGIWSEEKLLNIKISPPWWKTGIAYFIYVLLTLLALGGLAYGINLFVTKKNADEQINFFNSITHELKTPLAILLSTIDTIPKNLEHPAMKKIKSTSRQLISLFEQLLNFHLVTSDQQDNLNIKRIPLTAYTDKLIARFKPLLDEKAISFEIEDKWSPKNKSEYFYFDKRKLDKILFNLFSNAIKYSKENGLIKIVLDKKKEDLIISISDNGIGIPKDQQKYILKRYYRGRNAINSNLPGTGLGLMIVKTLVEKEKGSIKFTSVENQGSTFTVRLVDKKSMYTATTEKEDSSTKLSVQEQEALQDFSDAKILIVEDNNELRDNLVSKLGKYFQVYEAENGKEGLQMAMEIFPDLIVTDLIMPQMDGMELAKKLQNEISLSHIPIIMMTVLNSQKQKQESAEVGITAYLEKPINYNYLIAKIINALGWSKKLREKYLHQVDIENAEKFRNKKDAEFINKLEKFVLAEINEEGLSVHDLCSFVNMSRTALYMKLKSMVDLSPQNFIIHTRLKFARKKLVEGEYSVKEIAYMSGFSNPKYFSTSFKKLFGESPTSFIKNLKKE